MAIQCSTPVIDASYQLMKVLTFLHNHHIAYRVTNISVALDYITSKVPLIGLQAQQRSGQYLFQQ